MTPEQEAELGRGIYDREKVHALISAFADSAVELGANFLEVAEAAQAVGTSAMAAIAAQAAMADRADAAADEEDAGESPER